MSLVNPNLLRLAGVALADVLSGSGPADAILSWFFRQNRELGVKDRAFIAESIYGVLRRKSFLAYLADGEDARKLLLAWLLRIQGMSLRDLDEVLNKQQKEWAQAIKAKTTDALTANIHADLPEWLWISLAEQYGEAEALLIARSMHLPAALDLRVNTIKATREDVMAKFASEKTSVERTLYSALCVRMPQKMSISKHPLFTDGKIEVQDEGSQLLAQLVAPKRGEMVADFCAGAGGKSLALGALMRNTGSIYAFDVSEKRLLNLGQRLKRSGLSNLRSQLISSEQDPKLKRLNGKFNRVLVDAPCSGLGTLRRSPDLKWRQKPQDIVELTTKQANILARAAKLLKGGGRLVYATCSLLAAENEAIAEAFLQAHPEFVLVPANTVLAQQHIALDTGKYLKLFPHSHQTDGFFAAVFEKTAVATSASEQAPEAEMTTPSEVDTTVLMAEAVLPDRQPAYKPASKSTKPRKQAKPEKQATSGAAAKPRRVKASTVNAKITR